VFSTIQIEEDSKDHSRSYFREKRALAILAQGEVVLCVLMLPRDNATEG
jgi:hypothetical protein